MFVCAGIRWLVALSPTGMIPWLSKAEGNTYLLHHPFLFKGKTNASSRGSRKNFLAPLPGKIYTKPRHTKYPSSTLIPHITLFTIRLSFSSPPLLKRFSKRFAFSSPLFRSSFCLLVLPRAFYFLASSLAENLLIWIVIHLLIFSEDPIMMNQLLVI